MKYIERKSGETFKVPAGQWHRIACCDCGLIHDFVYMASKDRRAIYITVARNNRATAQRRRKART